MAALRVVIDTNLWVYLAENPEGIAVAQDLHRLQRAGAIDIMLPSIVSVEYEKLREGVAAKYLKFLHGKLASVREFAKVAGVGDALKPFVPELNKKLQRLEKTIPETLSVIDTLLKSIQVIPLDDAQRLRALRRLEQNVPPAEVMGQGSVGDCFIWETVLMLLDRSNVALCTNNTHDFSDAKQREKLHPALLSEIERKGYSLTYLVSTDALLAHIGSQVEARERFKQAEADAARLEKALEEVRDSLPFDKDALSYDTVFCEECGKETVVAPDPNNRVIHCKYCKAKYPDAETCPKCGSWILSGLFDIGVCDECLEYALGRD